MCDGCWPREKIVRCKIADMFGVTCGVCIVSRSVAGELVMVMVGAV